MNQPTDVSPPDPRDQPAAPGLPAGADGGPGPVDDSADTDRADAGRPNDYEPL